MMSNQAMIGETADCPAQGAAGAGVASPSPGPDSVVVNTRFGTMAFDPDQAITLTRGILGFPESTVFGLARLTDPRMQGFMLMQSLTTHKLSFLLMPLNPDSGILDADDLETARRDLDIEPDDLAVVLMVSIRDIGGEAQVSVNLRAPIFLDVRNQTGCQHVLSNGKYPIRYVLQPDDEAAPEAAPEAAVK